jgi:mono/diheme cytochrome c family protein
MRRILEITVAVSVLALVLGLAGTGTSAGRAEEGKQIFLDQKCNLCHSIESQGIEKRMEKMKGAELSNIGSEIESAEWLKGFLLQEKMKDGDKHQRKFSGSDEEFDTLVSWIMSLKSS